MNYKLLFSNLLLGPIVIFTYFKYLGGAMNKGVTSDQLWGNIKGNNRNIYYGSMVLATISYLYMSYYLIFKKKEKDILPLIGTIVFFIGAISWAPLLYSNFIKKLSKIFTYLSLSITSLGIIILSSYLLKKGNNI